MNALAHSDSSLADSGHTGDISGPIPSGQAVTPKPIKIQVVSDLHLEFPNSALAIPNNGADLLILSGDICVARNAEIFAPFFTRCADDFPAVVYIAGNHEFYHGDIDETHDRLKEITAKYVNLVYLNNEVAHIEGLPPIFGATLWTDCNKGDVQTARVIAEGMNDYRIIKWKARQHWRLRPTDTVELHKKTLANLAALIEKTTSPLIVAGHHAPSRESTHPRYVKDSWMNGGYSSDLNAFIEAHPQIALWTHGHTHDSFDYLIGATRVICNARGYAEHGPPHENPKFDAGLVVEI